MPAEIEKEKIKQTTMVGPGKTINRQGAYRELRNYPPCSPGIGRGEYRQRIVEVSLSAYIQVPGTEADPEESGEFKVGTVPDPEESGEFKGDPPGSPGDVSNSDGRGAGSAFQSPQRGCTFSSG
ncbi:hypothetical protein QR680_012911 [Steinernema hermaphroditum]|uniref:Uncharacterized protein n=1 Tax=Steinernema hermaphroditum TaxID=289476 RepID=A0AA39M1L4_9BILA|nr:hypothetical protein QR680_012911 [Steinernema hermaphroditum]